jgi:hypothetical protein
MNKSKKLNRAARRTRWENFKYTLKRIITFPWRVCCAIWNWLKSIDVVGMINLTLLVVIILLFSSLIVDLVRCRRCPDVKTVNNNKARVETVVADSKNDSNVYKRKIVKRKFNTTLPLKADKQTNIVPKLKTVGVDKPQIVKELSFPSDELPQQKLSGDVIVDISPASPILSNGVEINGNLIIQNMRKYTLPCDMKVNGHLFIRNVERLQFCGSFTVNGNIYVNRQSSFGALPNGTKINGQIIL